MVRPFSSLSEGQIGSLRNDPKFNPPVLRPALFGVVVGNGPGSSVAFDHHPIIRDIELILKVLLDVLGSLLGYLLIDHIGTHRVGVALDNHLEMGVLL